MFIKLTSIFFSILIAFFGFFGRELPGFRSMELLEDPDMQNGFTVLEGDPELGFCYPAICFLNENEMLVSYCFGQVNTAKQLSETRIRLLRAD
ncbi:MAG: hypothetical protein IJS90_09945 [Clostridia bacterium]|nr:hypothetical protein [Clostridia bacterium]